MEKKKILVAEDEPQLRKLMLSKFESSGFAALGAEDGSVALEKALKEHPDVILLDILMPVMDGIEMLRKLRTDAWGKSALVMLLSNLRDSGKVLEGVELGAHEYFVKSDWKLEDIVKKVKEKLSIT